MSNLNFKYYPGKVSYGQSDGRKINLVELEVRLNDGRLSICGGFWNARKTDYVAGGQCVNEVVEYFPNDDVVQRIHALWEQWHLNDMIAGSPNQMQCLKKHKKVINYAEALSLLEKEGLQPDPEYIVDGMPYSYGSRWLKNELPKEVIDELNDLMAIALKLNSETVF